MSDSRNTSNEAIELGSMGGSDLALVQRDAVAIEPPPDGGVIIYGERKAGSKYDGRDFAEGMIGIFSMADGTVVYSPAAEQDSGNDKFIDEFTRFLSADSFEAIHRSHAALLNLGPGQKRIVMIRGMDRIDHPLGIRPFALLRNLIESEVIHPVITASLRHPLSDALGSSGLETVCNRYRIRSLLASDLPGRFWNAVGINDETLSAELIRATGGQPLLIDRILALSIGTEAPRDQTTGNRRPWPAPPSIDVVQAKIAWIARNPPGIVAEWQAVLARILKDEPETVRRMTLYLQGHKIPFTATDPAPEADRSLYYAGWIGPVGDNQWGCRSTLHRLWAREVVARQLREPPPESNRDREPSRG